LKVGAATWFEGTIVSLVFAILSSSRPDLLPKIFRSFLNDLLKEESVKV
jgi:hypothetical protein